MAKRNVLVKDLRGVETLGAITCLATDKTGTLTRNQMTVTLMWSGQKVYDASSHEEEVKDRRVSSVPVDYSKGPALIGMQMLTQQAPVDNYEKFSLEIPELSDILHICYLCSKAKFDRTDVPLKQRSIIGDATEIGLFTFAANSLPDSDGVR